MKNVKVLIGNYGSGKSELALNFAMQAAARGDRTELIDLDMVNTYFRLTERGKMVEQKEIRLVSPNYACSGIETLSLPAEVASASLSGTRSCSTSAAMMSAQRRWGDIIRTLSISSPALWRCSMLSISADHCPAPLKSS